MTKTSGLKVFSIGQIPLKVLLHWVSDKISYTNLLSCIPQKWVCNT